MSKLSGKEKARIEAKYKEPEQEQMREERAERVSSGTYRPCSAVFSDKRREKQKRADSKEINDALGRGAADD